MFKKLAVFVAALAAPVFAFATAQDYSGISTALNTEIAGAMPTVLSVFGTIAAIGLGLRLIRKATHAS